MSEIPSASRRIVSIRDREQCARCSVGTEGRSHWHHRRSRSVKDSLTHSPANGVNLCPTCHQWVHANPFLARQTGFIVSRYASPAQVPIQHVLYGLVYLTPIGGWTLTQEE